MALSKGKKIALYFLLSTDSALRRTLEGRPVHPGDPVVGHPPTRADFVQRFTTHVAQLGMTQLPVNINLLYNDVTKEIAADSATILEAVDAVYDPDLGPCPDIPDEQGVARALNTQFP